MATQASGGVLSHVAYTTDSQFLLCCSGCVVKLFSTATGAQVRLLAGHTAEVTSVVHHPTLVLQAYTASLDGRILLWDLDESIVLRVICVGQPIISMALDAAEPAAKAFVLTGSSSEGAADVPSYCQGVTAAGRVYSVALRVSEEQSAWAAGFLAKEQDKQQQQQQQVAAPSSSTALSTAAGAGASFGTLARPWPAAATFVFKAKGATALAVGACGGPSSVVGALCGKMLRLHDVAAGTIVDVNQRREMSCVALSPTEPLAASGDDGGRICLWRVDGGASGPLRASEMHWHAQVTCHGLP